MKHFSTTQEIPSSPATENAFPLIRGNEQGWRMRAKLAIRGSEERPLIGLFREGSHEVIDMEMCEDHHPSIDRAVQILKRAMILNRTKPYDEKTRVGDLRYAQFFVSRETGRVQLVLVSQNVLAAESLARVLWETGDLWHSIWINVQTSPDNTIFGVEWTLLFGEPFLWQPLGKTRAAFHPGAFSQSNLDLFDKILVSIERMVPENARLLEVYAGVGAITRHVRQQVKEAVLIEENPLAKLSFEQSEPDPALQYVLGDASIGSTYIDQADCIIVDPPRKGLDPELLNALKRTENKTLIYLSCSEKSFERDAKQLIEAEWQIKEREHYLLFPHTEHVEIVTKWEKNLGERI